MKYTVNAYRIREIVSVDYDQDTVSFLVSEGPDGSDDVATHLRPNVAGGMQPPKVGDYWINPFGCDRRYVDKEWFELTYQPSLHLKINGHIAPETLNVLEAMWRKSTSNWGNQSNPLAAVKCVSDTHEESREKIADCLHPSEEGGEPNFIFINEEGSDGKHRTVAVTGNGPLSGDNADFIVNALVFMPDLIRTCRAALEHTCSVVTPTGRITASTNGYGSYNGEATTGHSFGVSVNVAPAATSE